MGQTSHFGRLGVQTNAPNYIIAWLKSPGLVVEINDCALSVMLLRTFASEIAPDSQVKRATTLKTFPSTATFGSPNAIEAMADAV